MTTIFPMPHYLTIPRNVEEMKGFAAQALELYNEKMGTAYDINEILQVNGHCIQPSSTILPFRSRRYAHLQKLHENSDVYSFGVVLLELFTGQPPVITSKNCHITQWVGKTLTTGDVANVFDPSLDGTYDCELVEKFVRLAIC